MPVSLTGGDDEGPTQQEETAMPINPQNLSTEELVREASFSNCQLTKALASRVGKLDAECAGLQQEIEALEDELECYEEG